MSATAISQYMRRKLVAHELGISRHTLARMIERDAGFPRFFEITPGITVIARADTAPSNILQLNKGNP